MEPTFKVVRIPVVEDDTTVLLEAFVYTPPKGVSEPWPVIVAGPGLTLTKDAGMQAFAEHWATDAGCASVLFDYRGFGRSDGAPRNVVSLAAQHEDFCAVLRWVREQPDSFQLDRIVVMGCGAAGLAVSRLAVEDDRLAGAMMHAPLLDGFIPLLSVPTRPRLAFWTTIDWMGARLGLRPIFIPAVGQPGAFALLDTPSAYTGVSNLFAHSLVSLSERPNVINARAACQLLTARPGVHLAKAQCPVLVVAPQTDDVVPLQVTKAVVARAGSKAELVVVPGGRFDMVKADLGFRHNVAAQLAFLRRVIVTQAV